MNEAKKQFIELLAESGAVLFGDFTAKSGRKTPYFINTGKLMYGDQLDLVGKMAKRGILRHKGALCSGDQNLIYLPWQHLPQRGGGDGAEADGTGAGEA